MTSPESLGLFWIFLCGVCAAGFAVAILSCVRAASEGAKVLLLSSSPSPKVASPPSSDQQPPLNGDDARKICRSQSPPPVTNVSGCTGSRWGIGHAEGGRKYDSSCNGSGRGSGSAGDGEGARSAVGAPATGSAYVEPAEEGQEAAARSMQRLLLSKLDSLAAHLGLGEGNGKAIAACTENLTTEELWQLASATTRLRFEQIGRDISASRATLDKHLASERHRRKEGAKGTSVGAGSACSYPSGSGNKDGGNAPAVAGPPTLEERLEAMRMDSQVLQELNDSLQEMLNCWVDHSNKNATEKGGDPSLSQDDAAKALTTPPPGRAPPCHGRAPAASKDTTGGNAGARAGTRGRSSHHASAGSFNGAAFAGSAPPAARGEESGGSDGKTKQRLASVGERGHQGTSHLPRRSRQRREGAAPLPVASPDPGAAANGGGVGGGGTGGCGKHSRTSALTRRPSGSRSGDGSAPASASSSRTDVRPCLLAPSSPSAQAAGPRPPRPNQAPSCYAGDASAADSVNSAMTVTTNGRRGNGARGGAFGPDMRRVASPLPTTTAATANPSRQGVEGSRHWDPAERGIPARAPACPPKASAGTGCFPPPLPRPAGGGSVLEEARAFAPAQHLAVLKALLDGDDEEGQLGMAESDSESDSDRDGEVGGRSGGGNEGVRDGSSRLCQGGAVRA